VRFAGWRSGAEVRECILDARALVLPSLSEGLPVVIMEALALRRPVIGTDVGGISELVEPGVSGWLVRPGSEESLARALRDALARPPAELDEMGRRGARIVAAAHDAAAQARAMAELFVGRTVPTRERFLPIRRSGLRRCGESEGIVPASVPSDRLFRPRAVPTSPPENA